MDICRVKFDPLMSCPSNITEVIVHVLMTILIEIILFDSEEKSNLLAGVGINFHICYFPGFPHFTLPGWRRRPWAGGRIQFRSQNGYRVLSMSSASRYSTSDYSERSENIPRFTISTPSAPPAPVRKEFPETWMFANGVE